MRVVVRAGTIVRCQITIASKAPATRAPDPEDPDETVTAAVSVVTPEAVVVSEVGARDAGGRRVASGEVTRVVDPAVASGEVTGMAPVMVGAVAATIRQTAAIVSKGVRTAAARVVGATGMTASIATGMTGSAVAGESDAGVTGTTAAGTIATRVGSGIATTAGAAEGSETATTAGDVAASETGMTEVVSEIGMNAAGTTGEGTGPGAAGSAVTAGRTTAVAVVATDATTSAAASASGTGDATPGSSAMIGRAVAASATTVQAAVAAATPDPAGTGARVTRGAARIAVGVDGGRTDAVTAVATSVATTAIFERVVAGIAIDGTADAAGTAGTIVTTEDRGTTAPLGVPRANAIPSFPTDWTCGNCPVA